MGEPGELLVPEHPVSHEVVIDGPTPEDLVRDGQGQRPVRAGTRPDPQVGGLGGLSPARVDDHHARPRFLRLLHERHLVDVRLGGILPPQDDQLRIRDVPWSAVPVVSKRQASGLEAGGPAEISVRRRATTEQAPEAGAHTVQQTLGAAARIVQHTLRTGFVPEPCEVADHQVKRFVPLDRLELAAWCSAHRPENAIRGSYAFHVGEALETDAIGSGAIPGMRLDAANFALFDVHAHAAGAVAVARACRREHGHCGKASADGWLDPERTTSWYRPRRPVKSGGPPLPEAGSRTGAASQDGAESQTGPDRRLEVLFPAGAGIGDPSLRVENDDV